MENFVTYYKAESNLNKVIIIHVLDDGTEIKSHKLFEKKYKNLFNINQLEIQNKIREINKKFAWGPITLRIFQNGTTEVIQGTIRHS